MFTWYCTVHYSTYCTVAGMQALRGGTVTGVCKAQALVTARCTNQNLAPGLRIVIGRGWQNRVGSVLQLNS